MVLEHNGHKDNSRQRVLLVQPMVLFGPGGPTRGAFHMGIEIPLALLYLESYLDRHAYDSKVLDLRLYKNPFEVLKAELETFRPQVVGVTAFEPEMLGASEVAKQVKQHDASITTIMGGLHASAIPELILQDCPQIDYVIHGEGELTLVELLQALSQKRDLHEIPGLAFRNSEGAQVTPFRPFVQNLDEFPFPDRSSVMNKMYRPNIITFNYLRLPTTGIIAGRGCPYDCYHCSKGVWGKTIRFRHAENIYQEMQEAHDKFDIRDFRFYDDILTMPKGPAKELCQLILDHRLKVSFTCYSRVNFVSAEMLKLMKQAGCYHIKYGIEFGTETSMKRSNRQTTLEQVRNAVTLTKKAGIMVKGNFMLGIPSETIEDCEKTIAFAKELSPDLVSFAPFFLFAGSRFHREIALEHKTGPEFDRLPWETLTPIVSKAYREFYFRPSYPFQLLRLALSDPSRLWLTIRVLFKGCFTLLTWFVYRLAQRVRGK